MGSRGLSTTTLLVSFFGFWLGSHLSYGDPRDVDCLQKLSSSVQDPSGNLKTWNFSNQSLNGFICKFTGVQCWHEDENRVLSIKLSDMGLKGTFPSSLSNCSTMTNLDLSSNSFSGSIPADISKILPYVTTLDLSSNNFSGTIPVSFANCTYLNVLKLDHNRFSGPIPLELGLLGRLKTFSVAGNSLTGPVPHFFNASPTADDYANNPGLCGGPLPVCKSVAKTNSKIIVGTAAGGAVVVALALGVAMLLMRRVSVKKKQHDPEGNMWAKSLKKSKGVKVSMFEKSISKMRLVDLMMATNNFSKSNIIGSGRTGTMYKAVLDDNTSFMVKRLQDSQHSEKEFLSEMNTLGRAKQRNLVPLFGFCMAKKERLLVYEYMPNGTLYDRLHELGDGENAMEWPLRLKIGIGAARGLAWLHHNCNPRIIHRNISSKCILLDENFEPKISDFGLARLMNPIDTHLSTFVNGEFGDLGYVAPEYTRTLVATPKGDIYSFGIVLLELVTSERPTHISKAPESFKGNLMEWVTELSNSAQLHDAIDEHLLGKGADEEVFQFLKIACNCVSSEPKDRPSMFEAYQLLRAIGEKYNFSAADDILVPIDNGDTDYLEELIVAKE